MSKDTNDVYTQADISLEAYATCPHCEEQIDLYEQTPINEPFFSSIELIKGTREYEFKCPDCGKTFKVQYYDIVG